MRWYLHNTYFRKLPSKFPGICSNPDFVSAIKISFTNSAASMQGMVGGVEGEILKTINTTCNLWSTLLCDWKYFQRDVIQYHFLYIYMLLYNIGRLKIWLEGVLKEIRVEGYLISQQLSIGFLNRFFFSLKLRSIHKFLIQYHFCAILGGWDICKT